jgi:hypothetical protein
MELKKKCVFRHLSTFEPKFTDPIVEEIRDQKEDWACFKTRSDRAGLS